MANGLAIQQEETARSRSVPWITRVEFETKYEEVSREEKETMTEIVRIADPDDAMRTIERTIPRETIRIIKETLPVDYVSWTIRPQSTGNVPPGFSDKVARMKKDRELWPKLEPLYEAWKRNEEPPLDGIPLGNWNRLSKAQHNIIREAGYKTIEDFATAPSGHLLRLSVPGILELQKDAAQYLTIAGVMKDGPVPAQIAVQMSTMEQENAALKQRLGEMEAQMHSVLERYRQEEEEPGAPGEPPVKRGPGRPRKYPIEPGEVPAA